MLRTLWVYTGLLLATVVLAIGCRSEEPVVSAQESSRDASTSGADGQVADGQTATPMPAALPPLMGGLVQAAGNYFVELLPRDDGKIEAQVRDAEGTVVEAGTINVAAEVRQRASGDGDAGPTELDGGVDQTIVQVAMTENENRFIGTVPGVEGPSAVTLAVIADPEDPAVETTFEGVELSTVNADLTPQHNGQVTVVGDNRVEVSTSSNGQVHVSVTDHQGVPIPPTSVVLRQVTITTPQGPQVVQLQPQGAIFVGTLPAPPPPNYNVQFSIHIGTAHYPRVYVRHYTPAPRGVVVVPPPIFMAPARWATVWRPPPVRHYPHGPRWGYRPPPPVHRPGYPPRPGYRPPHPVAHPPGHRPPGHAAHPGHRPPGHARPPGQRPPGHARPPGQRPPGHARPPGQRPPGHAAPPGHRPPGAHGPNHAAKRPNTLPAQSNRPGAGSASPRPANPQPTPRQNSRPGGGRLGGGSPQPRAQPAGGGRRGGGGRVGGRRR